MKKIIHTICIAAVLLVWAALTGYAWFGPAQAESEAERRPLDQWPGISTETVLDGSFMEDFESYTLDQFPLRDSFRQIKSVFHNYVMQYRDNNDIYIEDGYAIKLLYPLDETRVKANVQLFNNIYTNYLQKNGCKAYVAVVPDKSYHMAEEKGYLSMDYEKLFSIVRENMSWATNIDLTDSLSITDYYYTDTHWRQERLLPTVQKLCESMGVTPPDSADFTAQPLERAFYGVYYGQAALPMNPETMYLMQSDVLADCTVFDYETGAYTDVYNMEKLTSKDLYDVYLSGARAMLRIDNPNAKTSKSLIVFRDSFGSSIAPLLVENYASVTLVDLRYVSSQVLENYLTFRGQDVLFLYNTQVLNSTPLR